MKIIRGTNGVTEMNNDGYSIFGMPANHVKLHGMAYSSKPLFFKRGKNVTEKVNAKRSAK